VSTDTNDGCTVAVYWGLPDRSLTVNLPHWASHSVFCQLCYPPGVPWPPHWVYPFSMVPRGGDREILWVALRGECTECSSWPAPQEGDRKVLHVEIILSARPFWPPVGVTMGLHLRASKNNRPICMLLLPLEEVTVRLRM
jgi:hypothetical protein